MSTYYYLACEDCKKKTNTMIAVTRLSGSHIDSPNILLSFLLKHLGHSIQFFSEYDEKRCEYVKEIFEPKEGQNE